MRKEWKPKTADTTALKLIQDHLGCHPATASLLAQKNLVSETELQNFLHPSLHNLRPPDSLADMQKAVDRISQAVEIQEKILIFGD